MSSIQERIAKFLTRSALAENQDSSTDTPEKVQQSSLSDSDDSDSMDANAANVDLIPDSHTQKDTPSQGMHQDIADLKFELEEYRKSNGRQQDKIHQLSSALRQAQAELGYFKSTLNNARNDFNQERNALLTKLQKTQGNLDSAMTDLRKAQVSTFKQVQSDWLPEDDSKVREDVAQIYKDIRSWAKTYADSGTSLATRLSHLDQLQKDMLKSRISSVANFSGLDEIRDMKHPFLILAALLSDYLHDVIFSSPFFWLNDNPERPSSDVFNNIFLNMCRARISDAHMWRAQLMRFVFKNGVEGDIEEPATGALIPKTFALQMHDEFVHFFLKSDCTCFLKQLDDNERQVRDQKLYALVVHAGNLFGRLQTQRTSYQWTTAAEALGMEFSVSSPYLKADRLHKIDEDEDDTTMDGSKVKIVLGPVVLAHGNSQGEDYQSQRVISKATVYLDEGFR